MPQITDVRTLTLKHWTKPGRKPQCSTAGCLSRVSIRLVYRGGGARRIDKGACDECVASFVRRHAKKHGDEAVIMRPNETSGRGSK